MLSNTSQTNGKTVQIFEHFLIHGWKSGLWLFDWGLGFRVQDSRSWSRWTANSNLIRSILTVPNKYSGSSCSIFACKQKKQEMNKTIEARIFSLWQSNFHQSFNILAEFL